MSEADIQLLLEEVKTHLSKHLDLVQKRRANMEELTELMEQLNQLQTGLIENEPRVCAEEDATTHQLEENIKSLENLRLKV